MDTQVEGFIIERLKERNKVGMETYGVSIDECDPPTGSFYLEVIDELTGGKGPDIIGKTPEELRREAREELKRQKDSLQRLAEARARAYQDSLKREVERQIKAREDSLKKALEDEAKKKINSLFRRK